MDQPSGNRPTKSQELLLKASLLKGKEAVEAWSLWKSQVDINQLNHESYRLLPLLYHNLSQHHIQDAHMHIYRGAHRKTWYKNRMAFHEISALLSIFHDSNIRFMILKGAALILQYYRDHGLRPMDDVDILVHSEQLTTAIQLLTENGWSLEIDPRLKLRYFDNPYIHAYHFKNSAGQHIDLHRHALYECCYENADDDFWETAVSVKIGQNRALSLNPTDQLLVVIAHGMRWHPQPLIRWVADAMMILNTAEVTDWDRLYTQAQKRQIMLPIKAGLTYLHQVMHVEIPRSWMEKFQNARVSNLENHEYKVMNRFPVVFQGFLFKWFRYSRSVGDISLTKRLMGFIHHLQILWKVNHIVLVPFSAAVRFIKNCLRRSHRTEHHTSI